MNLPRTSTPGGVADSWLPRRRGMRLGCDGTHKLIGFRTERPALGNKETT